MSPSPSSTGSNASITPAHAPARPGLVWLSFAAVYVLWGSTYFFIRIGVETIPPFMLAGLRHLIFGLALFPIVRRLTREKPTAAQWRTTIVTGLLLLLFGNGLVSWAETRVPSGIAALLVATVSLWMVILDWLRPGGSRPVPRVLVGIILGFGGIALLVGPVQLGGTDRVDPAGAFALLFASFAWASGSIYSRHRPTPRAPLLGATMQSVSAAAGLSLVALLTGEIHNFHFAQVSTRSWLAVLYLVIFGSALGFSAYVYILRHSTASRVATYAFVNPVVALFLGAFFGQESVSLRTLVASATILAAVLLVITAPHKPAMPAEEGVPLPSET
jgi:drug/metabolite transporter (DMT)-like permease